MSELKYSVKETGGRYTLEATDPAIQPGDEEAGDVIHIHADMEELEESFVVWSLFADAAEVETDVALFCVNRSLTYLTDEGTITPAQKDTILTLAGGLYKALTHNLAVDEDDENENEGTADEVTQDQALLAKPVKETSVD